MNKKFLFYPKNSDNVWGEERETMQEKQKATWTAYLKEVW